ncbi:uncharacterized protein DS421_13g409780 [Arachis hypogaea]|nr:uncharacterized protein DS421_13g409780 [Arachis hypogaea]
MSVRAESECYVVFRRQTPKIYNTWEAAEPQVSGYPRNLHRRYRSFEAGWRAWVDYMHGQCVGVSNNGQRSQQLPVADAVSGGPHLCVNSSSHQVSLETQSTSPNESEDYLPGSDARAIVRLQHAVSKLEGRVSQLEVENRKLLMQLTEAMDQMSNFIKDEDSQQVTIFPESRLILMYAMLDDS